MAIQTAIDLLRTTVVTDETIPCLRRLASVLEDEGRSLEQSDLKVSVERAISLWKANHLPPLAPTTISTEEQVRRAFIDDLLKLVIVNIFPIIKVGTVTDEDLKVTLRAVIFHLKKSPRFDMSEEQEKWLKSIDNNDCLRMLIKDNQLGQVKEGSPLEKVAILILKNVLTLVNAETLGTDKSFDEIRNQVVLLTIPHIEDVDSKLSSSMLLSMTSNALQGLLQDPNTQSKFENFNKMQRRVFDITNRDSIKNAESLFRKLEEEVKGLEKEKALLKEASLVANKLPKDKRRALLARITLIRRNIENYEEKIAAHRLKTLQLMHNINKDSATALVDALKSIFSPQTEPTDPLLEFTPPPTDSKTSKVKRANNNKGTQAPPRKTEPVKPQTTSKSAVPKKDHTPPPLSPEETLERDFSSPPLTFRLDRRIGSWRSRDITALKKAARSTHAILPKERSDEEMLDARRRHHLPGTENLIASDTLKGQFCYRTPSGWNMFGALQMKDGSLLYGVIEHGIDETTSPPTLYHRFFKPLQQMNSREAYFKLDTRATSTLGAEGFDEGDFQPVGTTALADKNGTLRLDFENEDYRLHIFSLAYFEQQSSPSSRTLPEPNRRKA
ncbi:MAG: hypothetical protein KDK62_02935 [Chlamydiia bacterium]|nr:hypothetical protein [Chlamydiia bacterium]